MRPTRALLLAIFAVLALIGLALDPNGFRRTRALQADAEAIRAENEKIEAVNEGLRQELRLLADDPAALERAAREELGLVKPGEVVFRLEDGDGSP